ncbi:thymidylate synthase [Ectopseudomonas mendocina]|nr:thymidylate synthase [Pseudomonas mendocina]
MAFTLAAPCEYREEIRKSRFLAVAAPIASAAEAQAFIERHGDPSASHNCWAWKVGNQYRFNDDGEPGGTAGRPILAAIEGQDCDQVVVLVIRWYGGIQLGTGGLARAYSGSAAKCLQAGERRELVLRQAFGCHLQFAELALFKARLNEFDSLIEREDYDATGARLQLAVAPAEREALERLLGDVSRGRERLHSP